MQFQTKIIVGNKNPNARIAWAGGGLLFLAMVLMCVDPLRRYGFWLFGMAVVVLLIGAFRSKGDVDVINVSDTDLVIGLDEIRVGNSIYPMAQVSGIQFQVEGFDGMGDPDGYSFSGYERGYNSYGSRRGRVNGMDNYLDFVFNGEKQEWQFYLADAQQAQQLGALFKDLYARRVPFEERDRTGHRTFLFEPVSERELADRMIEYGYA